MVGEAGDFKRLRDPPQALSFTEAGAFLLAHTAGYILGLVVPPHVRHACGFKLANDGHDTRALQHYLGHKNIQHTVRYTEMAPDRFKDFWRD